MGAGGDNVINEIKKQISELPKYIKVGQQNNHIVGTHEYSQYVDRQKAKGEYGPSILHGDIKFAQELVDKYAGTGLPRIKNGKWLNYEQIKTNEIIGTVVNNLNGIEQKTGNFKIHYSIEGTHIVPDYLIKEQRSKRKNEND